MLINLDSDLPNFKRASFMRGLNIVVAHRTQKARAQDSRNAVGKTSFVTLLDFLLGSDARPDHPLRRLELADAQFELSFEMAGREYRVRRTGSDPANMDVSGVKTKLPAWRQELGHGLFSLRGDEAEPSPRALISFYLRSVSAGGFANATETHQKQSTIDTQPALAYLFGLDIGLVAKVREITESQKSLKELKRAAKDPVLGTMLGGAKEIDAEIQTLSIQRERLAADLESFQVVDRYSEQRLEAEKLSRHIRELNDRLVMLERRIADVDNAIGHEGADPPDRDYLRDVYEEVRVVLPDVVSRRFAEVEAFHESVVSNRRRYLDSEKNQLLIQLENARTDIAAADNKRSKIMRLLSAGGALETYKELQQQLGDVTGRLAELSERRSTLDRWENGNRHLQLRSAELELQVSSDLDDRRAQVEEISRMYSQFAYRLYGGRRPASLLIEPSRTGYKFQPTIGGDGSEGVRSMALFCFDLTMAVTAFQGGRGPDFLVHDSRLYDGVESRQLAGALALASEVVERLGMQYIVTLNSDDLQNAVHEDSAIRFHQCAELTDAYEDGGLFGIRFN